MPRHYKNKNVHTKPEKAGVENMSKDFEKRAKDSEQDELMENLIPVYEKGVQNRRTSAWSPEELNQQVYNFFHYCAEKQLKPSKAGIRLWLGISRSQYHDWQSKPEKYGVISDIIQMANDVMEMQYVTRAEKYPTANIFLLKTSHGHIETSKVDITSSNQQGTSPAEVDEMVKKLGLDKPKDESL